jgi:hypothetical protein
MARIFLTYRPDDAARHAERLYQELATHFGADSVQSDLHGLEHGVTPDTTETSVGSADVVLAIIGPRWLQPGPSGRRRIDDPNDHVRVELEAALRHDVPVIPVLVEGARMPRADELPGPLRALASRMALEIRDPASLLDADRVRTLVAAVERTVQPTAAEAPRAAPPPPAPAPSPTSASPPTDVLLGDLLRHAAKTGVVPASVVAPVPPPAAPPPPAESVSPPEYSVGGDVATRLPASRSVPLLRVVVPLVLLGAGAVVVAKWLLGWFVTHVEEELPKDTVQCTVFAPPSAAPGDSMLVQVFAHLPEQADDARAIAMELDTDARRRAFQSVETPVPRDGRLQFELRMPGLEVDDPVASLVWRGRAEAVQFGVRIPPDASDGTVIGTLEISLDGAPIGHVKFKLAVDRATTVVPSEPQGETARRYTAAFISYASEDREQVLARVQLLTAVGIRYFQDVLSLEPGDRWEQKLELGIDECDLFLLFWSSEAKRSEWVHKEVQYALARSGGNELSPPAIRPVILEGPPIVEPWEELAHLHFNDRVLYVMRPPGAE